MQLRLALQTEAKAGLLAALDARRIASRKEAASEAFLHPPLKHKDKADLGNIDRAPGKRQIEAPPQVASKRGRGRRGGARGRAAYSGVLHSDTLHSAIEAFERFL